MIFPPGVEQAAPVPSNPLLQQDQGQQPATLLPPNTGSHASRLAQTTPAGTSNQIGQHHVTESGKQEAFSGFEQNKQSITPWHQGPVTPFPLTMQDIEYISQQRETAGKKRRRRMVVILVAASLVLLVSLGSALFFVLSPASSSISMSSESSTQHASTTSQNPKHTPTAKQALHATPTQKANQTSNPTTPNGATPNPHSTATVAATLTPTSDPGSTPTPTSLPSPTPTPTPTPTPIPQLTETFTVPFTDGTSGVSTQYSYSGTVQVIVSGVGQASSTQWSDAFYRYTDTSGNLLNPPDHASCWVMYINSQPTDHFVSTPAYNSSHSYTFTMTAPGGPLSFGVCDGVTTDNYGSYTVTVTQQ
jgi:hypothetical protein